MTDPPLRVHVFQGTKWRDHRGRHICQCGSVRDASVHAVPEVSEEAKEVEARIVGERESTQDTETR